MKGSEKLIMEILTSYFYQIRYFKPWHIPFSTAVWDPHWYHANHGQNCTYNFIDKNGVINGLRIKDFQPNDDCRNLCRGLEMCITKDPNKCLFLKNYEEQLMALDSKKIANYFSKTCRAISDQMGLKIADPLPVLIVHEAPDNHCSERDVIQRVLNSKGFTCYEWSRDVP